MAALFWLLIKPILETNSSYFDRTAGLRLHQEKFEKTYSGALEVLGNKMFPCPEIKHKLHMK